MTTATDIHTVVSAIHDSPLKCSVFVTGGGSTIVSTLLGVAGASRTVVDAQVPYHGNATADLLDYTPASFVSAEVGAALAQAAYHRALQVLRLRPDDEAAAHVVGVGSTAAIATARQRRGLDVAFFTVWGAKEVKSYRLDLNKEDSREVQEALVCRALLHAIASAAKLNFTAAELGLPHRDDATAKLSQTETVVDGGLIPAVLSGALPGALVNRHGSTRLLLTHEGAVGPYSAEDRDPEQTHYLLYPGSFNPLHFGHTALADAAVQAVQQRFDLSQNKPARPVVVTYEIAVARVGKADITTDAAAQLLAQFTKSGKRVALTTAKLFIEKAKLFSRHGMVVGYDTAVRILDPKYYGTRDDMVQALLKLGEAGCYFVVGGRLHGEQQEWQHLNVDDVPAELRHMFVIVPEALFRVDISSTELRRRVQEAP